MGPYMEGNNHVDCNSVYSIRCGLNDTKILEHLEIVLKLVHAQYQGILWCSAFVRAV